MKKSLLVLSAMLILLGACSTAEEKAQEEQNTAFLNAVKTKSIYAVSSGGAPDKIMTFSPDGKTLNDNSGSTITLVKVISEIRASYKFSDGTQFVGIEYKLGDNKSSLYINTKFPLDENKIFDKITTTDQKSPMPITIR